MPPAAGLPGRARSRTTACKFKKFTPVDIGLRYDVLDKGQADLSIIFTTDAQLSTRDDVVTLEDDKKVFPPGNVTFVASKKAADAAGPDLKTTVEKVQKGLTERVMQELNARVDVDREEPRAGRAGLPARVRLHPVAAET